MFIRPPTQLMSSIMISFPDMDVTQRDQHGATAAATINSTTTSGSNTAPLAYFREAVNDVTGAISNINVAFIDFVACFVGPRHEHKLLYSTVTAISFLVVFKVTAYVLQLLAHHSNRFSAHDSNVIAHVRRYCLKAQLILIFLVYPALTTTIMRTFVCKK